MVSARSPLNIPSRLPVFPLSGVVLLPFGHLPLNIFEPRYVHMIDDALGQGRIIAMVQPRETYDEPVPDDARLFDIGTAARIIQFQDTGDGRYLITLEGLARFRLQGDAVVNPARGYREVEGDFAAFPTDLAPSQHDDGPGRGRILELMRDYFTNKDIHADWDAVSEAPYEALVSSLAMTCPFEPREKQALLECESHEQRARMLISLFEMSLDGGLGSGDLKH